MVHPEVIRRRLQKLADYLEILERLSRYGLEEFLADPEHWGSAERFLQMSLEATLDMGSHIIADESLGVVNQSRDIPRIFREKGFIGEELEQTWIRMIGFRNILVNEYLDVDREIVFDLITTQLDDIRAMGKIFARFLD